MSMSDDELETRYQRRFGAIDGEVPPTPSFESTVGAVAVRGARRRTTAVGALAGLAAIVIVVVVAVPLLNLPSVLRPMSSGSPDVSAQPGWSFKPIPDAPFPPQVGDLPVISVANALQLLEAGDLDGNAIAVAGYWDSMYPSCPAPTRSIGPLERWCAITSFAATPDAARVCQRDGNGNGTACGEPAGAHLSPFLVDETTPGMAQIFSGYDTIDPLPMVLIGHAGDPRQWLCSSDKQAECAGAFVVDRIGWALGSELHLKPAETADENGLLLAPTKTLSEIVSSAGITGQLANAAVFKAHDVASIDPRWPLSGDGLMWVIRTLGPERDETTMAGLATRPLTAWLVDDATGSLVDTHPLATDPGFQPARLWQRATVHGATCCDGAVFPHARVESGGTVVYEGLVSGSTSSDESSITFGGSYGSIPLVLAPGDYTITVWLASSTGTMPDTASECSLSMTLAASDNLAYFAVFWPGKPCTIERVVPPQG